MDIQRPLGPPLRETEGTPMPPAVWTEPTLRQKQTKCKNEYLFIPRPPHLAWRNAFIPKHRLIGHRAIRNILSAII